MSRPLLSCWPLSFLWTPPLPTSPSCAPASCCLLSVSRRDAPGADITLPLLFLYCLWQPHSPLISKPLKPLLFGLLHPPAAHRGAELTNFCGLFSWVSNEKLLKHSEPCECTHSLHESPTGISNALIRLENQTRMSHSVGLGRCSAIGILWKMPFSGNNISIALHKCSSGWCSFHP